MNYSPLLNPDMEPPSRLITAVDFTSWAFPALSALLAIAGGFAALDKLDQWAAGLSVAGGIIGAVGVLATNWASRVRDHRIEQAKSLAALGVDMHETLQRHLPSS